MEVSKFIEIVSKQKGANFKAVTSKSLKTLKSAGDVTITKMTSAVYRAGVDYENMKIVKEGRLDGTLPEENAGLSWGEWVEFPYHIKHKEHDYVRMYPASGLEFKPQSIYFLNGEEVSKEFVIPLCYSGEFSHKPQPCFTMKAENVVSIGNYE